MTAESELQLSLAEGMSTTRSIRRYSDEPVTDEQLATMMFLATRAPSGSNRQPFRFLVLRNGPKAQQARILLADGAQQMWREKAAKREFGEAPAESATGRMLATMQHYVDNLASAPVVILPCLVRYREPVFSEGASIYPAVQNLLLGARSIGLGGAMSMFHELRLQEIRDVLSIPDNVLVAATLTIGKPAGRNGNVRRRPLRDFVFEDSWDSTTEWAVDPDGTRFTGGPRAS